MLTSYTIKEADGVFCDAAVQGTSGELVFASLWGRDTPVQGLLGSLELGYTEGGITRLSVQPTDTEQRVPRALLEGMTLTSAERYDKISGRLLRTPDVHGTVVHMMLYDKRVRATTLGHTFVFSPNPAQAKERLWSAVCDHARLPLLTSWRPAVLEWLTINGGIRALESIGIEAWEINLTECGEAMDSWIGQSLRDGLLPIDTAADTHA